MLKHVHSHEGECYLFINSACCFANVQIKKSPWNKEMIHNYFKFLERKVSISIFLWIEVYSVWSHYITRIAKYSFGCDTGLSLKKGSWKLYISTILRGHLQNPTDVSSLSLHTLSSWDWSPVFALWLCWFSCSATLKTIPRFFRFFLQWSCTRQLTSIGCYT